VDVAAHHHDRRAAGDRLRRQDAARRARLLAVDGQVRGPELPDTYDWPAETRRWWQAWRNSAQAQDFADTDWDFLLETAVLHAEFWLGDRKLAAEIRLRVAKLGATPEDRARLRIDVSGGPPAAPARLRTKAATSRRERMLRAVTDES
jgi:hypothetical protein